jgi:antitoxin component of RelBE/YafQ-DinJ toxin-antitoxin module
MNITLSVDEKIANQARETARAMGKSLNQAVRDYLAQLAKQQELQIEIEEFADSAKNSGGRLNGWQFDRNDANER